MALCVALAHAEPEPEAWDGIRNPILGNHNLIKGNHNGNSNFGHGLNGRNKRSADPKPSAEPEAAAWYGFRPYSGNRQRGVYSGRFGGYRRSRSDLNGGYIVRKKRSADPEPVADADPEPEAEPFGFRRYGRRGGYRGFGGFRNTYYGRKKRSADPEPVAEPEPVKWIVLLFV